MICHTGRRSIATICADVSPFVEVEKCPDFRGTGTPTAIPLDVSSELASISETRDQQQLFRNWIIIISREKFMRTD